MRYLKQTAEILRLRGYFQGCEKRLISRLFGLGVEKVAARLRMFTRIWEQVLTEVEDAAPDKCITAPTANSSPSRSRLTKAPTLAIRSRRNITLITDISPEVIHQNLKMSQNVNPQEFFPITVRKPPFAYAQLELCTDTNDPKAIVLDDLQVKAYCTAALRQFLGVTGTAIPMDILKVTPSVAWLRVPREDLPSFAAALTAWKGMSENGTGYLLRLKQCSDWLGTMVGADGHEKLWES